MDTQDIFGEFMKKLNKELKGIGHANIIVAGKTGVGKSTLINAAFRGNMAETGIGKPVTKQCRLIEKPDFPLRIYDTVGLELNSETQNESITSIRDLIKGTAKNGNPDQYIHCMWYCIQSGSNRIEDSEINFITEIGAYIPVVLVLTQVTTRKQGLKFKNILESYNLPIKNILLVLADEFEDDDRTKPPFGVDLLVEFTASILPEGAQKAWVNAQKASLKIKREKAHAIVAATAAGSFGEAYIPLPFADHLVLVPTQIAMIAGITAIYGINVNKAMLTGIVTSLVGTAGTTIAGQTIAGNLLKFIPGIGTAIGGTINGATAALLTTALGETYIGVMEMIVKGELDTHNLENKEVQSRIQKMFKNSLKKLKKQKKQD